MPGFVRIQAGTKDCHTKVGNFYFIIISIFLAAFHINFSLQGGLTTFHDAWQFYILSKSPNIILIVNSSQEFGFWHMVTQNFSSPYIAPIEPLLKVCIFYNYKFVVFRKSQCLGCFMAPIGRVCVLGLESEAIMKKFSTIQYGYCTMYYIAILYVLYNM